MATSLSAQAVAEKILTLLPQDGSPVLNRVMRVMLAREFAKPVPADLYFKASDLLAERGKIGRSRGQGGHLFYVAEESGGRSPRPRTAEAWDEARLMEPLQSYLSGPFKADLDLPDRHFYCVQDTSRLGPSIGRWARPDFIVITAMRFKLLPGAQIDVHSFELKTETGATDLAVYEALAQLALLISDISSGICPRAPVPKIDLWKSKSSVTNMGSD